MNTEELVSRAKDAAEKLTAQFPEVRATVSDDGRLHIQAPAALWLPVAKYLQGPLTFQYMFFITAVDNKDHFTLVTTVRSMETAVWCVAKVDIAKEGGEHAWPYVASVVPVWAGADWMEREVYDLFGIDFIGHPDLRRIMTSEGFVGHPLRKDYVDRRVERPRIVRKR